MWRAPPRSSRSDTRPGPSSRSSRRSSRPATRSNRERLARRSRSVRAAGSSTCPGRHAVAVRLADRPLVRPARPGRDRRSTVTLTDAGGGAGDWVVDIGRAARERARLAPRRRSRCPGTLSVTATAATTAGDVDRFRRADARRRRPAHPVLVRRPRRSSAGEAQVVLTRQGRTRERRRRTVADRRLPLSDRRRRDLRRARSGPTACRITGRPANFGVVVTPGRVTPHVVFDGPRTS